MTKEVDSQAMKDQGLGCGGIYVDRTWFIYHAGCLRKYIL